MLITLVAACLAVGCSQSEPLRLSLIGTNDVHGALLAGENRSGLAAMSGYVNAVRAARQADDGAVLLIDAGDMWQGTLESNITEGASVVAAFNAMQYTAAAIGNHEFDFGPAGPLPIPESKADDPRGALKQRAREAEFPFLAANLIDEATGLPVAWDNVQPSVIVDVENVKVGINDRVKYDRTPDCTGCQHNRKRSQGHKGGRGNCRRRHGTRRRRVHTIRRPLRFVVLRHTP